MVKRLFKHEILYYLRTLLPVQAVLLGIALLGRFVQFFETDSTSYKIVFWSSVVMFIISVIACILMSVAIGVVRFYKNLFTAEGYLTFTLPVTPTQHILVKVCTAVLFQIISLAAVLLSVCIITSGDVLSEIIKAAAYLLKFAMENVAGGHIVLYIIEMVILFIAAFFSQYLLYYFCISVGQLFRKNRILAAVGVYFGYYMITQAIGTILTVSGTVLYNILPLEPIAQLMSLHPYESIHVFIGLMILLSLVICAVFFLIIRFIISRKLNLE